MEDLIIEPTASAPAVTCRWASRTVELSGESYPENSFVFFSAIIAWIEAALQDRGQGLTLNVKLAYLNTSSIKSMIDILEILERGHGRGQAVAVNWYYDEDNTRAQEVAEDFKEDITFPFNVIPVQEKD